MANEEDLVILRQGVEAWNAWRWEHVDVRPDLSWADLSEVNLTGANLIATDLNKADLTGADLTGADLIRTNLIGADLSEANLTGANLSGANLSRANLSGAVLIGANLSEAVLREAVLSRADLSETVLSRAILIGTNLRRADLSEANLSDADLSRANLSRANLSRANLSGAKVAYTIFADVILSTVNGLDKVQHNGPSSIGIDTVYVSNGTIPERFLRGCGVPRSLIEYLPSLLGAMEPIQFYSCFICYSSKDEDFARRLHERMQAEHLRVWFAPEDIKGGEKIHEQIERAIQMHDRLLLVLSASSMQSAWVQQELRRARRAELSSQRRKLFPIRLIDFDALQEWECPDSRTGGDLAEEVRQYFIPDFTRWKEHDAFEREFARLLRDLKAVDALPAQPLPPAPSMASTQPEQALIEIKQRRLAILVEQRAQKGYNAPPELIMEIEDLQREIAELGSQ
jgi:hypothetical protein